MFCFHNNSSIFMGALLCLVLLPRQAVSFVVAPCHTLSKHPVPTTVTEPNKVIAEQIVSAPFTTASGTAARTRLFLSNEGKKANDGTDRGAFLLAAVLLACIWIFSIPPEFRRAYLCGSERCVQDRSAYLCNDCMTTDEWKQGIADYYRNGGGIKFDFSIDPNSKMKFGK